MAIDYNKLALEAHKKGPGKLSVIPSLPLENKEQLCVAYTPGVAEPCRAIHRDESEVYSYTIKGHTVAVVTDGTAVLGLGDIGPKASLPVMEGKAALFKAFGGVDAVPIALDTKDPEEIIKAVKLIAPAFGGINLEDIASPKCFMIEKRLEEELDIPVFHDDQHGTGIVVTAGLMNAALVVKKDFEALKVVLNGPGAAGTAIIHMLQEAGVKDIIACDENGILIEGQRELEGHKLELARSTNPRQVTGGLKEALAGADVFIGVSVAGALKAQWIPLMAKDPIVFAMANPTPEIEYSEAKAVGVGVMGTGRSDNPNQINNLLAFPGIFRGALRVRARNITPAMKVAAAKAIAALVKPEELSDEYVIPSVFHEGVAESVALAVEKQWLKEIE